MKKKIIITIIILIIISLISFIVFKQLKTSNSFFECLKENNVVIYGTATCPACNQLKNDLKEYGNFNLIYVECNENSERCSQEMKTSYVPEIQINGVVFNDKSIEGIIEQTKCGVN